jgi:hypothetical protein
LKLYECVGLSWLALQDLGTRTDERSSQLETRLHRNDTNRQGKRTQVKAIHQGDAHERVAYYRYDSNQQQHDPSHGEGNSDPHWKAEPPQTLMRQRQRAARAATHQIGEREGHEKANPAYADQKDEHERPGRWCRESELARGFGRCARHDTNGREIARRKLRRRDQDAVRSASRRSPGQAAGPGLDRTAALPSPCGSRAARRGCTPRDSSSGARSSASVQAVRR